mgnify:CR=1 FL=1
MPHLLHPCWHHSTKWVRNGNKNISNDLSANWLNMHLKWYTCKSVKIIVTAYFLFAFRPKNHDNELSMIGNTFILFNRNEYPPPCILSPIRIWHTLCVPTSLQARGGRCVYFISILMSNCWAMRNIMKGKKYAKYNNDNTITPYLLHRRQFGSIPFSKTAWSVLTSPKEIYNSNKKLNVHQRYHIFGFH